ncbi:uncharacterized protein LOC123672773 [Harmonia axyridis]|uniref:uncharacterized protein LOC123672773 n=1 Tax=Harmonia axyridis TaxID=115357 RepID=UPI001E27754B|nr:uncharacterized protein LOC123672773 [Harmonia axyridis]
MYKTTFAFCLVALIVVAFAKDPIYSNNGILSGDDRAFSDTRIKSCVESCPTIRSLLVVCGSDGKSYANKGRVKCVDQCLKPYGESLQIAHEGFCPNDVPANERN